MRSAQKGQALLEILVALAIGVILVTAFVSLGAVSVRNSRFAKDQVDATKLAQEGVEAVITIRDQNANNAIRVGAANYKWSDLYSLSMNCAQPFDTNCAATDFFLDLCPNLGPTPTTQRCLRNNPASWQVTLSGGTTTFLRKIRITDSGTNNIKNMTVYVWWIDANGTHKSTLTRKLYRDRLE